MEENNDKENKEEYSPPTLNNNLQSHLLEIKNIKNNVDIINGTYSNDVALVENCEELDLKVSENFEE